MEVLLANERAAEQYVLHLLSDFRHQTFDVIFEAFNNYRQFAQAAALADFANAADYESRLWQAHTEARKHLHRALSDLRKSEPNQPTAVAIHKLTKSFLLWIKQSQRHFRAYIFQLSAAAGGIPELEAIAQREKGEGVGESHQPSTAPGLRAAVLESCHRVLVYLGDLSRYRASEKLDKKPDFGPAIGYYGLAATLMPSSGLGHHQQAVVALEQRHHLRAIYHLYRSLSVPEPHPNASNNLRLEFDKTNAAWDKGELIHKGPPNDPDAPKHSVIGWFVRLHSMCYRGEHFPSYVELEREVLTQLANVIKHRPIDGTLLRMVLVNIAAQYIAGERFQQYQTTQSQQSFYYYFRINLKTFTALLRIFYDDLRASLTDMEKPHEVELSAKLTKLGSGLLPSLRIYNSWLITMVPMIQGLSTDEFIADSALQFWPAYARALDLIAQAFPIWDLEDDVPEVTYMLNEDVETIHFKPIADEMTNKTWYLPVTGALRSRFSDSAVECVTPEQEDLHRVRDFLFSGVNLAHRVDLAPIHIRDTRIYYGDESKIEPLTVQPYEPTPIAPPAKSEKPKVVSYATAAANGHARKARTPPASSVKTQSREAQLVRMVDDLLDDEESNNPVTPPQPAAANPAIVTNGEVPHALQDSVHDMRPAHAKPKQAPSMSRPAAKDFSAHPSMTVTPPNNRRAAGTTPNGNFTGRRERLHSVSNLWNKVPGPTSPSFPAGLPVGTYGSPAYAGARGHSRVGSATSIRSINSPSMADSWRPQESSAPRMLAETILQNNIGTHSTLDEPGMGSPLLFGAGGGVWSTGLQPAFRNVSPPHGQGG